MDVVLDVQIMIDVEQVKISSFPWCMSGTQYNSWKNSGLHIKVDEIKKKKLYKIKVNASSSAPGDVLYYGLIILGRTWATLKTQLTP